MKQKGIDLTRLIPNIRGPSSKKNVVLYNAVYKLLLYGAPVWRKAVEIHKYRRILEKTQTRMRLRLISI